MELKDIDIENIELQLIESEISKRNTRIIKEKEGYIHCLDITETLKFYVDDDFKEEARLISKRIRFLKLQNAHTALFVRTVRDIFAKRLDRSGNTALKLEKLKLFSIEDEAKRQIVDHEHSLNDTPDQQEQEKHKSEILKNKHIIENVAGAREELQTLKEKLLDEENALFLLSQEI